jgi:AmmeMemoRadiSam system protein B
MKAARLMSALLAIAIVAASGTAGCAEGGEEGMNTERVSGETRRPVVAGTFYPGDPAILARDVDGYLLEAGDEPVEGEIIGIVSPHAGYLYSGGVAAHAYAMLDGLLYDTVVVVGPSHRYGFSGSSVYGGDGYETPLGVVPVDRELSDAIAGFSDALRYVPEAHASEHSLEVQVPFLQRTLTGFNLVAIIMGDQRETSVRGLAASIVEAVKASLEKRVLLVASTDLSHYHRQSEAVELDQNVVERIEAFDADGLLSDLASGKCEACGGGPTAVVMMAAKELGADEARVMKYATSGDVTGDVSQVVGYLSAVLVKRGGAGRPYEGLTREEKVALLELARGTIIAALRGTPAPKLSIDTDALRIHCGGFVTLDKNGRLRGCIGYVQAVKPLAETVSEMAVQAALHDPRFAPVTADEIDDLERAACFCHRSPRSGIGIVRPSLTRHV